MFLPRNSACLKKQNLKNVLMHAYADRNVPNHHKFAACMPSTSLSSSLSGPHNFSTLVCQERTLLNATAVSVTKLSCFSISSTNYVPVQSHGGNPESTGVNPAVSDLKVTSEVSQHTTDRVLFVDANPVHDSATEIIDKATTDNLSSSFSSSHFTEVTSVPSFSSVSDTVSSLPSVPTEVLEPSLASLGLGSWYPVGIIQQCLEFLHINSYMPMPWWLTIVTGTVIARVLMFPIFIKAQRNAAELSFVLPQLTHLQDKFNEARRTGNAYEAARWAGELAKFTKLHNVNPLKNVLIPLTQMPVFLSFFLGLRAMANLPIESMKIGGFSWITDLTIPDPFYLMPLCACTTLYVVLRVGGESGVRLENMKLARYFITVMPVIVFPFIMHFPSAVLFYWCTNNFLTLGLVLGLKVDKLRTYFGISKIHRPDPAKFGKKKGFVEGFKDALEDQKVLRAVDERKRMDEVRFRKAGTGPIPRTYSYDPTKPRPAAAAAAAASKVHAKPKT